MLVFVYGSLKRGGYLHDFYLKGSKFVGEATTTEKMLLAVPKKGNRVTFPALYKSLDNIDKNNYKHIKGELYHIDMKTLKQLDRAEGYPDLYDRQFIKVKVGNKKLVAIVYTCNYIFKGMSWSDHFKV